MDAVSYGRPRDTKPTRGAAAPAGIVMVVASLVGFIRGDIVPFCVNLAHRPPNLSLKAQLPRLMPRAPSICSVCFCIWSCIWVNMFCDCSM